MSTGTSFNAQPEISDGVRSKRFGETTAPPSIPHPNREQALRRARLTAGFPNVVNGQRIDSSRRIKISDPVTGEELASVTDTQKDGLDQGVQAAKAAFPLWSSKSWNERRDLLASAMEELKAHNNELCTILTAENGRPYRMAQFEITWVLETAAKYGQGVGRGIEHQWAGHADTGTIGISSHPSPATQHGTMSRC
jgi:delta 1-pyrroline-5-carboxylate dehydrogenase